MLWGVTFLAIFVGIPVFFLVVLLLRGNLSSWAQRHRAVLLLSVAIAELASAALQVSGGVAGTSGWIRLAWLLGSGVGFLALAFKARREDPNPEGAINLHS